MRLGRDQELPHVGRLTPTTYFAQGYSGQGVAIATLVGKLIAEAIAGQAARFDVYASLKIPHLPGGALFRKPLQALGLFWYPFPPFRASGRTKGPE